MPHPTHGRGREGSKNYYISNELKKLNLKMYYTNIYKRLEDLPTHFMLCWLVGTAVLKTQTRGFLRKK